MKIFKATHVAVAPMYESEPTTPHVYNAARDSMAGLRKKSGLSVAAWQALKAYGGMSLKRVLRVGRMGTNQPEKMFLNGVLR